MRRRRPPGFTHKLVRYKRRPFYPRRCRRRSKRRRRDNVGYSEFSPASPRENTLRISSRSGDDGNTTIARVATTLSLLPLGVRKGNNNNNNNNNNDDNVKNVFFLFLSSSSPPNQLRASRKSRFYWPSRGSVSPLNLSSSWRWLHRLPRVNRLRRTRKRTNEKMNRCEQRKAKKQWYVCYSIIIS